MNTDSRFWIELSEAFAFLGNSLLAPISQTDKLGIDPSFWRDFPDFGDSEIVSAAEDCFSFSERMRSKMDKDDLVREISVEYTYLFVGPPSPAAAPWETFYRNSNVTVGFSEATFLMQQLLREAGLQVSNENNQYADHIGIELLYLSVLCGRAAQGGVEEVATCMAFASEHLLSWIGRFSQRVDDVSPAGYYSLLLQMAESLLGMMTRRQLSKHDSVL